MFTNIPPSSQIYGTWNVAGTGAVDDGSSGYYQRVERQLYELTYWLEQLARKKPIQQSQQRCHSYLYICYVGWNDNLNLGYDSAPIPPTQYH